MVSASVSAPPATVVALTRCSTRCSGCVNSRAVVGRKPDSMIPTGKFHDTLSSSPRGSGNLGIHLPVRSSAIPPHWMRNVPGEAYPHLRPPSRLWGRDGDFPFGTPYFGILTLVLLALRGRSDRPFSFVFRFWNTRTAAGDLFYLTPGCAASSTCFWASPECPMRTSGSSALDAAVGRPRAEFFFPARTLYFLLVVTGSRLWRRRRTWP
ncbi:hypothetical protein DFH06DRAFT_522554 [Mycena polygramma]|nr:hypothetical protein DFH06DRAFT_522554 [Mycena polygramma]